MAHPRFPKEIEADYRLKVPEFLPERPRLAPAKSELLKRTRSVCPTCLAIVDADVAVVDGRVMMFKSCSEHGPVSGWISDDATFYRKAMNGPQLRPKEMECLTVPLTHRCNVNCVVCFVPNREREDLSRDELMEAIEAFPGSHILLSGGEPTLREDLPELIRTLRATGRTMQVLTNGIELADGAKVKRLREAGLDEVLLQLNSLRQGPSRCIHGRPLLHEKMMAFENCVKAKMEVGVSATLFRGVNDDELGDLLQLCLDHAPEVRQLRIRGACRVGRHTEFRPMSIDEIIGRLANALGRDPLELIDEFEPAQCFHSTIQFNMLVAFDRSTRRPFVWNAGEYVIEGREGAQPDLLRRVNEKLGAQLSMQQMNERYIVLAINAWSWPDRGNIDFQEIWCHGVCHLIGKREAMNFCEAVFRANAL